MTDSTDRDAAPAAAEGADIRERLLMRLGSHQRFCSICRGKQPGFVCQWEQGMLNALEVYDAARPAPAAAPAAEGADAMVEDMAQALHSLLWHHGPQPYSDRVYRWRDCHDPYCAKMRAVVAARPAPPAAPREGGVVGAVLGELEWRHWSTRDGSERMCLVCERDESEGHAPECRMAAAIEAARGDAYEGTYHRPIVDASGHELVGDGTPWAARGEGEATDGR